MKSNPERVMIEPKRLLNKLKKELNIEQDGFKLERYSRL